MLCPPSAGFFYGIGLGPKTMPLTKRRIRTVQSHAAGAKPAAANAAYSGSVADLLQEYTETIHTPPPAAVAVKGNLAEQVATLQQVVSGWDGILREITQSVFACVATTAVDSVPYFTELPKVATDLAAPHSRLAAGQLATLVYPQLQAVGLLFMRLRVTDAATGEIEQFYVPVSNMRQTNEQAAALLGTETVSHAYFDHFHNPGETDPSTY